MYIASYQKLRRALRVASVMSVAIVCTTQAATPDLSGPWQIKSPKQALLTIEGKAPPLLPTAQATYQANIVGKKSNAQVDPVAACLPPGVPRLMTQSMPFNIVQGLRTYAMMFEWNHLTRLIYMDRGHFKPIGPIYLGQSIGHWEGNVLVIDTNSFNDETWLDDTGLPHSTALHITERIQLINGGRELEDRITFEDAKTFSAPWTAKLVFAKKDGVLIKEDYCLGRTGHGVMHTD